MQGLYDHYSGKKEGHFFVHYIGTENGRYIHANDYRSAKWIFALEEGLKSIAYLKAKIK